MSLYKQLWLAIICLLLLIFSGSFIVGSLSVKTYLEQQLFMKNSDNAAALALSLTQQDADPVLLELTLSAQFDTGHYELIQLTNPEGNVVLIRQDQQSDHGAPQWFINLFSINVQAGEAQVQQGWQQVGTLTLRSHTRFAYRELWENTQKQAGIFLLAIVLAGLLGSYLLKIILRPLDDVVSQAKAIGEQRFISFPEPSTLEFQAVVHSMNALSKRIKGMLQREAHKLEKWRKESNDDKVTGLDIREPFLRLLSSALQRNDASTSGVLTIIRISNLSKLNQRHGRKVIDTLLRGFGDALKALTAKSPGWAAGRLNGSDFGILAPRAIEPEKVGREAQKVLLEVLQSNGLEDEVLLPGASASYQFGDNSNMLLTSLDAALLASESQGESQVTIVARDESSILPVKQNSRVWLEIFEQGFRDKAFSLARYPVTDLDGGLIHTEGLARLEWDQKILSAGQFLPWINRLDLAADLDKHIIKLALRDIQANGKAMAINLSYTALSDPGFLPWLSEALSAHTECSDKLCIEVQESIVYRHLETFKKLCIRVQNYGCKLGMEHVGHQLSDIGQLHDVGLDYIKIDSALIRGIENNAANQMLVKTLGTLGHSLGVTVIAEGVQTPQEWSALESLGMDGVSGPEVTRRGGGT